VAAVLCAVLAHAAPVLASGTSAPVVAELFTSQGCSSCPPAEAVLAELSRRSDVLALAFHVTYWNDLGWRDLYSLAAADARQSRYAGQLGNRAMYTPQLVINGSRDVVGSQRTKVLAAIQAVAPAAPIRVLVEQGAVSLELPAVDPCDCELLLLGVLPATQTAVGRGENAGRVILEFNVVRGMAQLAGWDGHAGLRTQALPAMPPDASRWVVLAQRKRDGQVIAAGATPVRIRPRE
jgi:hypothetical protein